MLPLTTLNPLVLVALAFAWLVPFPLVAAELPDLIDRVRPAVVGVGTAYPPRQPNRKSAAVAYRGTAFIVGNGNQAITNAHVIPDKLDAEHNQMLVIFVGRGATAEARPVRVVRKDDQHDVALLAFQGTPLPALALGDSGQVREGMEVAFTGYPIGAVLGLYPVTHRGIVAAITPMARPMEDARTLTPAQIRHLRNNQFDAFQLDAIAYPGNSGSPVYDTTTGKVIGVLNSVFVKESRETMLERPSGISYAIPANYIKRILEP